MAQDISAISRIEIKRDVETVWNALTDPELIRQYLSNTRVATDWEVGSPISFMGDHEGKAYHDKGTILVSEAPKTLKYTFWNSLAGKEDVYDNYTHVLYQLKRLGEDSTELTITNEKLENEEQKQHMEESWTKVLQDLKKLLESEQ